MRTEYIFGKRKYPGALTALFLLTLVLALTLSSPALAQSSFLSRPTNLTVSGTTLSWDAVPGAQGYRLRWRELNARGWNVMAGSLATTSHTFSSRELPRRGVQYRVSVQALGRSSTQRSRWSASAFVARPLLPRPTLSRNGTVFTWNAIAGAAGYEVTWYPSRPVDLSQQRYETLPASTRRIDLGGRRPRDGRKYLQDGLKYAVAVRAQDARPPHGYWSLIEQFVYHEPTATPTATSTSTATSTATATPTATASSTATATPTATATATSTSTPTATATATSTSTATSTATATATATSTATATATATKTPELADDSGYYAAAATATALWLTENPPRISISAATHTPTATPTATKKPTKRPTSRPPANTPKPPPPTSRPQPTCKEVAYSRTQSKKDICYGTSYLCEWERTCTGVCRRCSDSPGYCPIQRETCTAWRIVRFGIYNAAGSEDAAAVTIPPDFTPDPPDFPEPPTPENAHEFVDG